MGNGLVKRTGSGGSGSKSVTRRAESMNDLEKLGRKSGKIAITGRYHMSPKDIRDDYTVLDTVLGSGFNGEVKMAEKKDKTSGLKYAVKAFKLFNIAEDKRQQLRSEVEVFLCMDHPHVTRLYEVYEGEDFLHLVMECMEGGELFDRVIELKIFNETLAAEAVNQMLLALNYIHSHGIVHRDIKLENFLYDKKGSNHLKLIDFGFSKMGGANTKMQASCGTLAYVAPEVLLKSYDKQCDLWSLGVIAFILLSGYMPFSGSDAVQTKNISEGKFVMKPDRWGRVSEEGQSFILGLLQVDPTKRLTAAQALEHTWVKDREKKHHEVDHGIADALRSFGQASKFRRCCMEMMAWSLTNEERSQVRDAFIAMDETKQGTITLVELRKVLEDKFDIPGEEVHNIFQALDQNQDEEIHYSDFLAAMVGCRIQMHDDHLKSAFKRFDKDNTGYISVENLYEVLGDSYDGESIESLLSEADLLSDGRISYPEFVSYLTGRPIEQDLLGTIVDQELQNPNQRRSISKASVGLKNKLAMKIKASGFRRLSMT